MIAVGIEQCQLRQVNHIKQRADVMESAIALRRSQHSATLFLHLLHSMAEDGSNQVFARPKMILNSAVIALVRFHRDLTQ